MAMLGLRLTTRCHHEEGTEFAGLAYESVTNPSEHDPKKCTYHGELHLPGKYLPGNLDDVWPRHGIQVAIPQ